MQDTAQFHHEITDALLSQADPVFHNTAALDTAVDRLDPQAAVVQGLVGPLLLPCQLLSSWLLGRHEDCHVGKRKGQAAQILQQSIARGQGIGRRVRHGLLMGAAAIGVTEKEDEEQGIDEQAIFDHVVLFLAALTRGLFKRVLGADDLPFHLVMGTRGEADAAAGMGATGAGSSSSGTTTVAASASETPRRWARAVRERAGAAPRIRSAASSAGKRTWIH
jgi:hypothetical protein